MGPVNTSRWSSTQGVFLATASMDGTVRVWDTFPTLKDVPGCVATLRDHTEAVLDVQWNADNTSLLSGSFDKTVLLTDLETCTTVRTFRHKEMINSVSWHPVQSHVFLAGAYRNGIACWDSRAKRAVAQYSDIQASVQALEWLHNGQQFISSSDVTKRNSIDRSILVWDFASGKVMSNQVYQEVYTCPSLRVHPDGSHFIAQSTGNYIVVFSSEAPYKLNKHKKFVGHSVEGYRIGVDISPDGSMVASGSADGSIHFYSWCSGKPIKTLSSSTTVGREAELGKEACTHVAFHPLHPQMLASCYWNGSVVLFS